MPDLSALTLRTPRLLLRPHGPDDVPLLFALFSDPQTMRYWSSPPWTDPDQAVKLIERDRAAAREGAAVRLGIVRSEDGRLVGNCTLFHLDAQCRRAEVGYSLAPAAQGRGLATEAVGALLDWGFDAQGLGLNRVEADIDLRNRASARLLERLGFVREGHLRERWIVGGEKSDSWLYGLLAAERPRAAAGR